MKRTVLLLLFILALSVSYAQKNFPINGITDPRPSTYAFKNATIFVDYQTKIENAILLIKDGSILAAGSDIQIPKDATIFDLKGKYIYPGFIDIYTNFGMPETKGGQASYSGSTQFNSKNTGPYGWNDAIKSEFNAIEALSYDEDLAQSMRKSGISTVLAFRPDGIVRGSSVLLNLSDDPIQENIVLERAAGHYSFKKGSSTQAYPSTFMGGVALLRQTYYDAQWYASSLNASQTNISLENFLELQSLPQIVEVSQKYELIVADEVGDEFDKQYIIKGNGDEYQRLDEIKRTNAALIIPVDFPNAYDVEDPDNLLQVSLKNMKHWELAPKNPAYLESADINFAFTMEGLKSKDHFLQNIRKAVKYGLSEKRALEALTATPAKLLKADKVIGTLSAGKMANFIIVSDSVFKDDAIIYENWVRGNRYIINDPNIPHYQGEYDLEIENKNYTLKISGKSGSQKAALQLNDTSNLKVKSNFTRDRITLSFELDDGIVYQLSGWRVENGFKGNGNKSDGSLISWQATYSKDIEAVAEKEKKEDEIELGEIIYPFAAYGWTNKPSQETIIFKNATVWTNENDGILQNMDVLVSDGKIREVGKDLQDPDARVIDASGKHLTSGVIDEHSHIALSAVNEGTSALASEVRMKDVLNPESMSIYRQLAGGVTASQLLHGSANPVGAQSAIIKLRWGAGAKDLLIDGADPTIKFALGENVKQSNWGPSFNVRFPQTRMGVEQVYMDAFSRAKAYKEEWEKYDNLSRKEKEKATQPRRDLRLEALAEILDSKRFITCHSYVQSEINMLMHVADHYGFRVNTFTHILEGYKVADKMKEHGAAGSTFSDWWGYKYEVKDAIPYNMVLMHNEGVLTAVNSDDAEMARRLNQEAAKAVKYGDMSEEDAWKMVTLNPAKMLHLEDRMGSIMEGKDADIVIWSDNPLSIYAKAELTMVDGAIYYELQKDREMREWVNQEKARLAAKMMEEKKKGMPLSTPVKQSQRHWHCDD
ncbi:MAG: amidohydrolase family protein, partial [Cyclobacteriaceae bacterium]